MSEISKKEGPKLYEYTIEDKDYKIVLFHIFKKILNYCVGKCDMDSVFNFLTDGNKYLSVKRLQMKLTTIYPKITTFETNVFLKYVDSQGLGLLYYDDYDVKILKLLQLFSEKLNIILVRSEDNAPILTTQSNKVLIS